MTAAPSRDSLIAKFRALGTSIPEHWADAYLSRGPSVLAQAEFMAAAWRQAVSASDTSWIDRDLRFADNAGNPSVKSLARLLSAGAIREDIARLVRQKQLEAIQGVFCLIDNVEGLFEDPVTPALHWHLALFENCPPEGLDLGGLHEEMEEGLPPPAA